MARIISACDLCWTHLLQQGARLQGEAPGPARYCDCCRSLVRPGGRVLRFLVPGR